MGLLPQLLPDPSSKHPQPGWVSMCLGRKGNRGYPLDNSLRQAYKGGKGVCPMMELSKRNKPDLDDRRVIFLEFVAATTIFAIIALVLYMVFTYRPA